MPGQIARKAISNPLPDDKPNLIGNCRRRPKPIGFSQKPGTCFPADAFESAGGSQALILVDAGPHLWLSSIADGPASR